MSNSEAKTEIIRKVRAKVQEESNEFEPTSEPQNLFSEAEIYKAMQSEQDGDVWLFVQIYRDQLRYDHAAGKWNEWKENYWEEDKVEEILTKFDPVIEIYEKEAFQWYWRTLQETKNQNNDEANKARKKQKEYLKKISFLQKKRWKRDVLELAAAGKRALGVTGEEWDLDPWALGCPNGVINLKNGTFRAGKQTDYIKTISPTKWKGIDEPAPEWEKFLNAIFDKDPSKVSFLQRLLGYSITGLTTEHIIIIAYGIGRNGKGTLFEVIHYTLGPLAGPVQAEMLLDQGRSRSSAAPSSDIMALRGRRIAWGSESDEGRKFNAGKVKWLVGGDALCGREPFGKREVNFKPTHTLYLLTNHKPKIDPSDYALWQRIHLIPFTLSFIDAPKTNNERKRDPNLSEKLKKEASGILAWLVRGCLEWQKHGLNPPKVIKEATSQYKTDEDDVGRFISECCYKGHEAKVKAGTLYDEYKTWCKGLGLAEINGKRFGQYIKDRFEATKRTNTGIYYKGIGLINKIKGEQ